MTHVTVILWILSAINSYGYIARVSCIIQCRDGWGRGGGVGGESILLQY